MMRLHKRTLPNMPDLEKMAMAEGLSDEEQQKYSSLNAYAISLLKNVWDIHVSIDLETPVVSGDGIFSIGMVPFSPEKGIVFHELAFYARFDFCQVMQMTKVNPSTMRWWLMQSDEARMEIIHTKRAPTPSGKVAEAPLQFFGYHEGMMLALQYLETLKTAGRVDARIFPLGNGKEFDVSILTATLDKLSLIERNWKGEPILPWNFWDAKDLRERLSDVHLLTGGDLKKVVKRVGVHHNALDDAMYQANLYMAAGEAIEETREALLALRRKLAQQTTPPPEEKSE